MSDATVSFKNRFSAPGPWYETRIVFWAATLLQTAVLTGVIFMVLELLPISFMLISFFPPVAPLAWLIDANAHWIALAACPLAALTVNILIEINVMGDRYPLYHVLFSGMASAAGGFLLTPAIILIINLLCLALAIAILVGICILVLGIMAAICD